MPLNPGPLSYEWKVLVTTFLKHFLIKIAQLCNMIFHFSIIQQYMLPGLLQGTADEHLKSSKSFDRC